MGFYIEVPNPRDKAQQLKQLYGAQVILEPKYVNEVANGNGKVVVCVVENGPFDAAAIIYNQKELLAFAPTMNDRRKRTYLLLDKNKAIELCPRVAKYLEY